MKKIIVTAVMLMGTTIVCAQTFEEWFRQKATQKKYFLRQIAALKVYGGYLSKGYEIVQSGLNTIEQIKHGDFDLHDSYFKSLQSISPQLRGDQQIAGIVLLQNTMARQAAATIRYCSISEQLTSAELGWLHTTFTSLLADGSNMLDALSNVLTGGALSMKDDERMARIHSIYNSMQENATFCSSFSSASRGLCTQRKNEQLEIQQSKKINQLK